MSDYIVYWRSYWDPDEEHDEPGEFGWSCDRASLYEKVVPGDVFWVVVSGGPNSQGEWRLLEKMVIKKKRILGTPYGRYRFEGDASSSQRVNPNSGKDLTQILKSLEFTSGKKITLEDSRIGQALQSPRTLTPSYVSVMQRFLKEQLHP